MVPNQKLSAIFYRSAGGNEPVREWLKRLDKSDRQTIGEDIAYVQYKSPIGKLWVDHLRGPVWDCVEREQQNRQPYCTRAFLLYSSRR